MDKQAREAYIRGAISRQICMGLERGEPVLAIAQKIINSLNGLGYRKLPKAKPPLLSAKELRKAEADHAIGVPTFIENESRRALIAQAQRGADIKFYS